MMSCRLIHAVHDCKPHAALRKGLGVDKLYPLRIHLAERRKEVMGNLLRLLSLSERKNRIRAIRAGCLACREHTDPFAAFLCVCRPFVDKTYNSLRCAVDQIHLGLRGVVAVLHTWRLGVHARGKRLFKHRVQLHFSQHFFQHFNCDCPRAEQDRDAAAQIHNGRLKPHRDRTAVKYHIDFSAEILRNVPRFGRTGTPGGIRGGRRNRQPRGLNECSRIRIARQAHGNGIQTAAGLPRHALALFDNHGERPRPEGLRKAIDRIRDFRRKRL